MLPLSQCPLFAASSEEELQALADVAREKTFSAGDVIFSENDAADGLYIVAEGIVEILARTDEKTLAVLATIRSGDFFGEMAVIDRKPRSATARAERDSKLWFIEKNDFEKLLRCVPNLTLNLLRECSLRMREFDRHHLRELFQAEKLALVGRLASSIIHDLKNPLSTISLAAQMLEMGVQTPQKQTENIARIHRQVGRISNMINELLEFTRPGGRSGELAPIRLSTYLTGLINDLRQELQEHSVELRVCGAMPDVEVALDPARMTQVFRNLVFNAVEAMPEGGSIEVECETGERVEILLRDSGPGIPAAIRDHLFEPFVTHGKVRGTGLGLSICKRIVVDHGGEIRLNPEEQNGAEFQILLPLINPPSA